MKRLKNLTKTVDCDRDPEDGDKLTELNMNSSASVHANLLLRTPVFTPSTRTASKSDRKVELNTKGLIQFGDLEGYSNVQMRGVELSVETDFKIWTGIVRTIQDSGYQKDGQITVSFSKFAESCGYKGKRLDRNLRERIDNSLMRIMTQVIRFSSKDNERVAMIHLVSEARYDTQADTITIQPHKSLWQLYKIDYTTILTNRVIDKIPRSETAVCLYMFIQSLPKDPAPISYERIRDRLRLTGVKKEQNRSISNAIKKLIEIGYLKCHTTNKDGESYLFVDARDPKLKFSDENDQLEIDDESDAESE